MEEREWRNEESCYRAAEANEGNRMRNLIRTSLNRDKCQMAGTPVVSEFSSPYGNTIELRSIERATSQRCRPPLLQATESRELCAKQHDQPDNKQVADLAPDHREYLYLEYVKCTVPKSFSILARLGCWKIKQVCSDSIWLGTRKGVNNTISSKKDGNRIDEFSL
jgi:hypothetical protein